MKFNKIKNLQAMVVLPVAAFALCACGSNVTDVTESTKMSTVQAAA